MKLLGRKAECDSLDRLLVTLWPERAVSSCCAATPASARARCSITSPTTPTGGTLDSQPVSVPVAFTTFPGEIWKSPRSWVEASYPDVAYFNEVDRGGHFAAWEEPQLFSEELRAALRSLR
jgi:pimeloyl-ACP methyl ester carboxylesterase